MSRQLTFDLPVKPALGREDFFVSTANALAVTTIEHWQGWPQRKLALIGPHGSGKTHLVQVWAAMADAQVVSSAELATADIAPLAGGGARLAIEDVDRIAGDAAAEQALFHLHNLVLAEGGYLLLSATSPPLQWPLTLPDLASRMQATGVVLLTEPDDDLLRAVLLKLFDDRQLSVSPGVVDYLATRMERGLNEAARLVAALDDAALREGRAITRKLAASVLDKAARGTA